jgi:hypothetical protein
MMFFSGADDTVPVRLAVPLSVQVIVIICVAATIWIGLYPPNIIQWANDASRQLLAMMP